MLKAKLCSFAIAGLIGCASFLPMSAYATETNNESVTLSEKNDNHKERKAAFEESIKKANQKWNSLTAQQKAEVYALIEDEMKSEMRLLDKLAEFEIISKEDAAAVKGHLMSRFGEIKKSGEFPFMRQRGANKQK